MKIAVLFHRFGPYHWARLAAASKSSRSQGHELVGIETSGVSKTYAWEKVDETPTFRHVTVHPEGDINDLPKREIATRIQDVLSEVHPDVLAVYGWAFADVLAATDWCVRTGTPSIVMSDSAEEDFARVGWKEALKRRIVQTHQAGLVGGKRHKRYLSTLGMPSSHIRVGYDVVENQHFTRGAAAARKRGTSLRRRFGLPGRYFLASSRFVEKKNLRRLLEAYAQYQDRCEHSWDLVVLGDGPLHKDLLALRQRLDLDNKVHFPGFKQYDELPTYYGLAEAFVHASTREQWGLVVNEAMAAGLPVLVSQRCGCAPDLVDHGENGFIFDPYDIGKLADYMLELSDPCCDLGLMGDRSQEIIAEWTPDTFAKSLLEAAKLADAEQSGNQGLVDRAILKAIFSVI